MSTFFAVVLVASLATELMAATFLIGGPNGVAAAGTGEMWAMHYGFAALAIASASAWVWRYRRDPGAVTVVLGTLMTFHTGLFVSLTLAGDQPQGQVMHAILATCCVVLFVQRKSLWAAAS